MPKTKSERDLSGKTVAVIGGGPAGLIAAETLARAGVKVTVYDRMPSLGRKFLLAGRGGLNLTHSEPLPDFLKRYGEAQPLLRQAVEAFPPAALRAWADTLGADTFVGSSGRVFPKAMKTSPLLRTWLLRLRNLGVTVELKHRWTGLDDDGRFVFEHDNGDVFAEPDAVILAAGGASWPKLGSDGAWTGILRRHNIDMSPWQPSNCGFTAAWSDVLRGFAGQPLKRIAITNGERSARGEAMITQAGIEGGAIYALSSPIRDAVNTNGTAVIAIDLLPDVPLAKLTERLSAPRGKQSLSNFLRKNTHLAAVAIALLHEAALAKGKPLSALPPAQVAALIKAVPITLTGVQPIETAISSAGGVLFDALDDHFMLKKYPGVFAAGEMLDWEAPTGGYLLQASFATGVAAANGALEWLRNPADKVSRNEEGPPARDGPSIVETTVRGPSDRTGSHRGGIPGHGCRRLRR